MIETSETTSQSICQKTLANEVFFSGRGLFTGKEAQVTLRPASENSGIVFQRVDLPSQPLIPAIVDYVKPLPRCSCLEKGGASIQTIEHLLSALAGVGITNLEIKISGDEVPILDGSALPFIELLLKAGVSPQLAEVKQYKIKHPIFWQFGDAQIVAFPNPELRLSYLLHYPDSEILGTQFYSYSPDPRTYEKEIAPARTFSVYEEIEPLLQKGWIKGGGLDNALIIKNNQVLNPEGMRMQSEPVRHKMLDLIGDLSLIGCKIVANVVAIRSGHAGNIAFAKEVRKHLTEAIV